MPRTTKGLILLLGSVLYTGQLVHAAACPVVINELMAANADFMMDPQGQSDDWVEFYNPSSQTVDVAGMYLTDDPDVPTKWQVPTNVPNLTRIPPRGYLLIWLDGDTADSGLHAGFKLDAADDAVALFGTDGKTLVDSVAFKDQRGNVSYGRFPNGTGAWQFLTVPTPGGSNAVPYLGVVADTKFSRDRGFYDAPFDVTITCKTPGTTIYYTLDGSEPGSLSGRSSMGSVYSGPIRISKTTCLRARAVKNAWLSSNTDTHTYIFLDDVVTRTQAEVLAGGYPAYWFGSYKADYEMDPQVYTDPAYAGIMDDAMRAIPTVSLVTNKDHLFSRENNSQTGGIYIYTGHSSTGGQDWERPVSVEMFTPDGSREFQADGGIRIQGGESRRPDKCPKHSLSLRFRSEYGQAQLEFPLFEGSPVNSFDSLQFRGFFNNAWTHWDAGQRQRTQYIRDQWMRDSLLEMGHADAGRGFYVHLYINGIYWGLYNLQERPVASHYAAYYGGDEDRIDAINGGKTTDGTIHAWQQAKSIAAGRDWTRIQQVVDVDNFIDWTLLGYFAGNVDLKTDGNWRAAGGGPDQRPWRFYSWDGERVLENVNQTGVSPSSDPTGLFNSLKDIEEFRLRFGDRVHRHLFNGGALTPERTAARWTRRADEIGLAVIAESARWGDYRRDVHSWSSGPYLLYTRNAFWIPEKNRLLSDYFPRRTGVAFNQFKSLGLYPSVTAPAFHMNGTYQHGGHAATGGRLSMQGAGGEVWYTVDGSDPRVPGVASRSTDEVKLVAENAPKRVLVPTAAISDAWRTDPAFNDSAWTLGVGGVGYERSSGYESYIGINVQTQMYNRATSCYIRIPFTVAAADVGEFSALLLRIRYDDGFVAYLNGTEVQRALFTGTPAWNSSASGSHSDSESVDLQAFDLRAHLGRLRAGANLLAIHGLNQSTTSSDFLISAELAGRKGSTANPAGGVSATAVQYSSPIPLQRSACVKARALSGGTWSALNEAVFAVGPVAEGLRISEIMFHPAAGDPNTEYIELTNIGIQTINLNLVRFTDGIEYTFPSFELPAGGYCLLVQDIAAFEARYGTKLPVVGRYAGNLSNGGERIELVDAAGAVIHAFEYDDKWFDLADGLGFSLTVKAPETADADSLGSKQSWRPSAVAGGSPGADDSGLAL